MIVGDCVGERPAHPIEVRIRQGLLDQYISTSIANLCGRAIQMQVPSEKVQAAGTRVTCAYGKRGAKSLLEVQTPFRHCWLREIPLRSLGLWLGTESRG